MVGAILRRNDFLHPPEKFQKFTKRIVQRRKTFLNSPLMITEATLNGKLLIPQQILEQMQKIR